MQLLVIFVLEENGVFFLVTKVDDVITLKMPITANLVALFLAVGVLRCESCNVG
ncbi:exosporium protein G [Bacillus sp. NPDC094106]|uniref:exosporium protein G n=1 Tax=Bacillus sp. NPDC094106 TaxID=3363949 RepID=UPI00381E3EDA